MKNILIVFILAFSTILSACKDEETQPSYSLDIEFDHTVNGADLSLPFDNLERDGLTIQLNDFKYYISNIKFLNENDEVIFEETNSYHLIRETVGDQKLTLSFENLSISSIHAIELGLGVDPETNISTDNTGDLDISNDMAWNWDTGYKFILLEGEGLTANQERTGLVYHVGGSDNYQTVRRVVSKSLSSTETNRIVLQSELLNLFQEPNYIDLSASNVIMGGENAARVTQNYAANFFTPISE